MKSIRTNPANHAPEGDERIRTAVPAPGADPVYEREVIDRRIDALQSNVRSLIYGQWGAVGRERAREALAALEELEALARFAELDEKAGGE